MPETPVWFLGQEVPLEREKLPTSVFLGFPVAQTIRNCLQCGRPGFNLWIGKTPWRKAWQPTPVFLSGESHGQRSLVGYSPWGHKESDMTERLSTIFDALTTWFLLQNPIYILVPLLPLRSSLIELSERLHPRIKSSDLIKHNFQLIGCTFFQSTIFKSESSFCVFKFSLTLIMNWIKIVLKFP